MNTVLKRWASPTPKFFKKVRNIGLVIGALGTAILTAPVSIPLVITTVGGYLVTIGSVVVAVSQLTINQEEVTPSKTADDGQ